MPRNGLFLVLACCAVAPLRAETPDVNKGRVVYLGGRLSPEELVSFTCTLQAARPEALVLLDAVSGSTYSRAFLESYYPACAVPVGAFPGGTDDLQARLKLKTGPRLSWNTNPPPDFWYTLFPRAGEVVVCARQPRRLLLQAACLAVARHAPLFLLDTDEKSRAELQVAIGQWQARRIYAIGQTADFSADWKDVEIRKLPKEDDVFGACLDSFETEGPITSLVVANPEDIHEDSGGMSSLAPWIAGQRRAPLLLTNECGDNVDDRVADLVHDKRFRDLESVLLVGSLSAIQVKYRANPIPLGKDNLIEMEPLTPAGNDPYSFAVGRLFSDCQAGVTLQLARQRFLAEASGARSALVASNPGGTLPLLETFSRTTALELQNAGYGTTKLFGKDLTRDAFRREMARHDVILWEGHHSTLIRDWGMPEWDEPLASPFIMLQSCLALQESKAQPLLRRGAVAVVGTSTRTFSASGGAMSLAFFNAVDYDRQPVGAALRQAKNFMLAYSLLKERKLGDEAKRTGANQRAAWSFTLWGDPTLTLPSPPEPDQPRAPVRHVVHGNSITLHLPEKPLDRVLSAKYQVQMPANGRLAGLIRRDADEDNQPLVPFLFAEVHLPQAPDGKRPTLKCKLPASHHVFCWDARRKCGYLLVEPRSLDESELRCHITWEDAV